MLSSKDLQIIEFAVHSEMVVEIRRRMKNPTRVRAGRVERLELLLDRITTERKKARKIERARRQHRADLPQPRRRTQKGQGK